MRVIDASVNLDGAFEETGFSLERWERYIDTQVPGAKTLCLEDAHRMLEAGYTWEGDFLPVLNAVRDRRTEREAVTAAFHHVADTLDDRIRAVFGRSVDTDLVLYLGLCNGAGWVTELNGRITVLLGLEKILELEWGNDKMLSALIFHELGHVYQGQYGVLQREDGTGEEHLLWQLFTEGIAMVFEQQIAGGPEYFHQDRNGWKTWCDDNIEDIKREFRADLATATLKTQRWFGDWVQYRGQPDVGYYLGARFVQNILRTESFDGILAWGHGEVREAFERFCGTRKEKA